MGWKAAPHRGEWEYAARGGLPDSEFAWGSELNPGGGYLANTWPGDFLYENLELGDYAGTSPVWGRFRSTAMACTT